MLLKINARIPKSWEKKIVIEIHTNYWGIQYIFIISLRPRLSFDVNIVNRTNPQDFWPLQIILITLDNFYHFG